MGSWLLMCSNFVVCAPVDSSPVENSPWAFSPEVLRCTAVWRRGCSGSKRWSRTNCSSAKQPASQHIFQYSVSQRKWHGTSHISGKKKFGLLSLYAVVQQLARAIAMHAVDRATLLQHAKTLFLPGDSPVVPTRIFLAKKLYDSQLFTMKKIS